jgi:hypothetical protein
MKNVAGLVKSFTVPGGHANSRECFPDFEEVIWLI